MASDSSQYHAVSQEDVPHHHTPRSKRKVGGGRMQLNLTAMIDVTFQLLIYFIITAAFTPGEGVITAKFPMGTGEKKSEEPPKKPLTIRLTSTGRQDTGYRIDIVGQTSPPSFSQLAKVLQGLQLNPERNRAGVFPPDNPIVIKPSGRVRWAHVVNAFNAAVKADYTNVAFAQAEGG